EEIGDIVQTINLIADRTNLLSLNASIEAARAGEHGRGFAVVAEEIRALADRAAAASADIAKIVRGLQSTAREALTATTDGAKVATTAENVSRATADQASGATELAKTALQMRRIAHQTSSALATQTRALSASGAQVQEVVEATQRTVGGLAEQAKSVADVAK